MIEGLKVNNKIIMTVGGILIIFLCVEVVILILQNRNLKARLDEIMIQQMPEILKSGDQVDTLKYQLLDGTAGEIIYDNFIKRYLFFVFSTTCPHCDNNINAWNALTEECDNDQVKVLGISKQSTDKVNQYKISRNFKFEIASILDTLMHRNYKLSIVPQTIVINGRGIVEINLPGILSDKNFMEIKKNLSALNHSEYKSQ